jgi:hypothetical protein
MDLLPERSVFPARHDTDHVNVLKEVSSSGAWLLLVRKMDTNISEESHLPVFRLKRGWKERVTPNYRVSQQERWSGVFLLFQIFWECHIWQHIYIHTLEKRCFSFDIQRTVMLLAAFSTNIVITYCRVLYQNKVENWCNLLNCIIRM